MSDKAGIENPGCNSRDVMRYLRTAFGICVLP